MLQFHFLERKRECEMHQAVLGRGLATPFLQLLLLLNPGVSLWWGGFETSLPLQSTTVPGRDRAAPPAPMGQGGKASALSPQLPHSSSNDSKGFGHLFHRGGREDLVEGDSLRLPNSGYIWLVLPKCLSPTCLAALLAPASVSLARQLVSGAL